jgi:hypothetical protein
MNAKIGERSVARTWGRRGRRHDGHEFSADLMMDRVNVNDRRFGREK